MEGADGQFNALYCASSDLCLAWFSAGDGSEPVLYRLSSGVDWLTVAAPPGGVGDIACFGSTTCVAGVGESASVFRSNSAGGAFDPPKSLPTPGRLGGLSCGLKFCIAFVDDGSGTGVSTMLRYDGNAFTIGQTLNAPLASASCSSDSYCVAVTESGETFKFDGNAWTQIASAPVGKRDRFTTVKCFANKSCAAIDTNHFYLLTAGAWKSETLPGNFQFANSLACSYNVRCILGSERGEVVSWTPGQWSEVTTLFAGGGTVSTACDPDGDCIAIDTARHSIAATAANDW